MIVWYRRMLHMCYLCKVMDRLLHVCRPWVKIWSNRTSKKRRVLRKGEAVRLGTKRKGALGKAHCCEKWLGGCGSTVWQSLPTHGWRSPPDTAVRPRAPSPIFALVCIFTFRLVCFCKHLCDSCMSVPSLCRLPVLPLPEPFSWNMWTFSTSGSHRVKSQLFA